MQFKTDAVSGTARFNCVVMATGHWPALLEKKKFAIANFLKLKIWKKDYGKRKLV